MTTGEEIYKLAIKHEGEDYILGAFVPKNNSNWKGPWDCAEFVSWCVYQTAEILYGCTNNNVDPAIADAYTGSWGRDARKIGIKITPDNAAGIKGAAVLRLSSRTRRVGHIVISDGNGGTIEAHSSRRGVIRHTLSGRSWSMGILVSGIEYKDKGEIELKPPKGIVYKLKHPMMSGAGVKSLQRALKAKGFDPGKIDGFFGNMTYAAVVAFQASKGLVVDGEAGPITLKALGL